jgi:hypothetical protein
VLPHAGPKEEFLSAEWTTVRPMIITVTRKLLAESGFFAPHSISTPDKSHLSRASHHASSTNGVDALFALLYIR